MIGRNYYKVVRAENKKLVSTHAFSKNKVRYVRNQWTIPKSELVRALFVFNNLHSARQFVNSVSGAARIYECDAEIVHNMASIRLSTHVLLNLPKGTALAKRVKLLRRVQ